MTPSPGQLDEIERTLRLRYPASFRNSLLQDSDLYRKRLPGCEWIISTSEIQKIRAEMPHGLLPFIKENQGSWFDIYAFDLAGFEPENPVVVWSDNDIVANWENYEAFADWLRTDKL